MGALPIPEPYSKIDTNMNAKILLLNVNFLFKRVNSELNDF